MQARTFFLLAGLSCVSCGGGDSDFPLESGAGNNGASPGSGDAGQDSFVGEADSASSGGDGSSEDAGPNGSDSSCGGGCGSPDAQDAGGRGGDAKADAAEGGNPFPSGDGGLALYCWQDTEYVIGPLNSSCSSVADCAIVSHVTSCCGATTQYGINQSATAEYQTENANCAPPACTCIPGGPFAQDGMSESQGKTIAVKCENGTCLTYVP